MARRLGDRQRRQKVDDQEMFKELLATILDALEQGDLPGHIEAWLQVVQGKVSPDDTVRILEERAPEQPGDWLSSLALQMAKQQSQGLTSTRLAEAASVCSETARTRLASLVEAGSLKRVGRKRGTRYLLLEG